MSEATNLAATEAEVVVVSTSKKWLEIASTALDEFVETAIGEKMVIGEDTEKASRGYGGYLQLSSDESAVILGLVCTDAGADAVTRGLLMMEADEEVTTEDKSDAIGEVVNVFGGTMKTLAKGLGGDLKLDLPFIVQGRISVLRGTDVYSRQVSFCGEDHWLTVIIRG
ncbi:MAG: chemotaxis protein CheX [Deltaproteobacteria bacterium]|nr:chemotaxis protein CheX [Deltaproteobacteria bacterium]